MKLISCYIENFGAIKQKEIKFEKNLTSICEENGYGKTTIASFLEAMFYGMEPDRSNKKDFGMRRHFNPFAGGKFGGYAVFSIGRDRYKIERYFDASSETRDSLTVYKNDERFEGFGDKIGEKIFGIDKQSFERTIFIAAREIEITSTGSISAKLNNFVEGSTDETNTDKALKRLEEKAKEYQKKRGANDRISNEQQEVRKINDRISNAETIMKSLPEKYKQLSDLEQEDKKLSQEAKAQQKAALELKDWERYDGFTEEAERATGVIEKLKLKYGGSVPSSDEISGIKQTISEKKILEKQIAKSLSLEEKAELSLLHKKYEGRMPTESEISDKRDKIVLLAQKESEISSREAIPPTENEIALRERFKNHVPTEKEIKQLNDAVGEYEIAEKACQETPDYIFEVAGHSSSAPQSSKKKYLITAIIAAIIAVVGIGVLFVQTIPGVILLVAGAACLLATGFIYLNKKASVNTSDATQRINPEKTEKERIKNSAEMKVRILLAPYGYSSDKNINVLVEKLKSDLEEYNRLVSADGKKDEALAEKKAECEKLGREIDDYFKAYGFTEGALNVRLSALQKEINSYIQLKNTSDRVEEQKKEDKNRLAELESKIQEFCAKYHIDEPLTEGKIGELEKDVKDYTLADSNYNDNFNKAKKLKEEKNLNVRPVKPEDNESQSLEDDINQLKRRINNLKQEISDCETSAEELDNLNAELENHKELLNKYIEKHRLLELTQEYLREADKRLKDKYIAPIKNKFVSYAELLESALGEKVTMTPSFEIRYEHSGQEYSEKHLSAGQRSICAFCLRMALIENMYAEEKPFIILDDPFANLDRKHMDRVKDMLKKLSEKLQLVYFTCHESRAI